MTYCLAIRVDTGLVFCSDSRTHGGIDNVGTYSKMHRFGWSAQRHFCLLSAGNLATTQSVLHRLRQDIQRDQRISLRTVPSLDLAADYVGSIRAEVQQRHARRHSEPTDFTASFLLGGQIGSAPPGLRLIYPQGNAIHESSEHPFLQMGEVQYGKPLLDMVTSQWSLEAAARCALASMDATLQSNLSVGPPVELLILTGDRLDGGRHLRWGSEHLFLRELRSQWHQGLAAAIGRLPPFPWEESSQNREKTYENAR
ncbi:hypothetical protein [Acidithiobacillus caldus]|uniref:hypothetical protein n=1 Tax=Acidithiobacillus caldus TaxID=33059 RepID=UPI001D013BF5|nr:hypothetical protein [Acidithiobacillus caldus]MBU2762329.1 hypothetical protein [Acidithiobacillus caldus]MBU2769692.1 hypothetical protein [Acidithiobacillus caldus]